MVRFSEIGIKSSKTRKWLTNRLISHIRYVLRKNDIIDFEIENRFSRILISSNQAEKIIEILSKYVPGISSVSIVEECATDFGSITQLIEAKFFDKLYNYSTFAVKVKRTGKHSFTSVEFAGKIGEFILSNYQKSELKVDLTNPEYTLNLEIRENDTYIFDLISRGIGGLPAGCQGNVLVLITGEKEDISNAFQLYKRGATTSFYSIGQFTDYPESFQRSINELVDLQPRLKKTENIVSSSSDTINIEEILEINKLSKSLGIVMAKPIFEEISSMIPTSIPIFVPHLVDEMKEEELMRFHN